MSRPDIKAKCRRCGKESPVNEFILDMAEVITIDNERVKYECPKCKFSFVYNTLKNIPPKCAYCGSEIFPFKTD